MTDFSDDDLLAELGIDLQPVKTAIYTAKEERIVSGFEEINQFYEQHTRTPANSLKADIFERIYAVRLQQIKLIPEVIVLLKEKDKFNLLSEPVIENLDLDSLADDELLSALGQDSLDQENILVLNNVRTQKERQANDQTAIRKVCEDFSIFKGLFNQIQIDIEKGARITRRFGKDASIQKNDWFILDGQLVYISEVGGYFKAPNGDNDARLRAIYSNATESNLLMRSMKKSLNDDPSGRRVLITQNIGPLFNQESQTPNDEAIEIKSGSIYVLKSLSDHPYIEKNRSIIHKIGVTTGKVIKRITEAKKDATYLLADVEIVSIYALPENIAPHKLEKLIHKVLQSAQLNISIEDRFGNPVKPKEWFLVPLNVIDEIVKRVMDGTITEYSYNPSLGTLENV